MPSFNNITTTDNYQEFRFRRIQRVTVVVSNNPIFAQFAIVTPPATLQDLTYDFDGVERDMANGNAYGWTPADFQNAYAIVGIKIKSEISGLPAVVTIHA